MISVAAIAQAAPPAFLYRKQSTSNRQSILLLRLERL
jgi:hypothetical protein